MAAGLGAGGGGTDHLIIWDAEVSPLDSLPFPWTVRVIRNGEAGSCAVTGDGARPLEPVRSMIRVEAPDEQPDGVCSWCWEVAVETPGRICRPCVAIAEAQGAALDLWPHDATASGRPLAYDIGVVAGLRLALLELEHRRGWFTLRVHVSGEGSEERRIPGRWVVEDDRGNRFAGFIIHLSGSSVGRTVDVVFAGDLDPRSTQLTVVIDRGGVRLLEVDLPIEPPSG
ncbi:MAG: hypothetical protein ACTHN0_11795 [Aquihabitans sp.]